jgi:SRSO17 transposase
MADRQSRLVAYVQRLAGALGHADRAGPLRAYRTGLLLPGERKSVEPMAAKLAPRRVGAAPRTRRCTTSSPRRRGTTGPCSPRCGIGCCRA